MSRSARSIHGRFLERILPIALIAVVLVAATLTAVTWRLLIAEDLKQLREGASLARQSAAQLAGDGTAAPTCVTLTSSRQSIAIVVRSLRDCSGGGLPQVSHPSRSVRQVLSSHRSASFGTIRYGNHQTPVHASRVGNTLTLLVIERDSDTPRLMIRIIQLAAGVVLIALALMIWIVNRSTSSITRPMAELTREMAALDPARSPDRRLPGPTDGLELEKWRTTMNELLDRLSATERRRVQLLLDVSHDLRTPLVAIRSNSQLLLRMLNADQPTVTIDQAGDMLRDIDEQSSRLNRTLESLLQSARSGDPDSVSAIGVSADLNEAVARAAQTVQQAHPTARFQLIPAVLPVTVSAPPDLLYRVLENLMVNSCVHGVGPEDTAQVTVTVRVGDDNFGCVSICDTGRGSSAAAEPGGRGLRIAGRLLETVGGSLSTSDNVDGGWCATVAVPMAPSASPQEIL